MQINKQDLLDQTNNNKPKVKENKNNSNNNNNSNTNNKCKKLLKEEETKNLILCSKDYKIQETEMS
jgi:hypothetical protein